MGMWEEHGVWHLLSDRDEQVQPAAEALRVVLRRRLHIRDAQGEMTSLHSSSLKPRADRFRNVGLQHDPYLFL